MKLLLAVATEQEIAPLLHHLQQHWKQDEVGVFHFGEKSLQICIHGVGMVSTTFHLTKLFQKEKFDFAIQAGIGGSFTKKYPLGEVVMIGDETLGDLGAEDHFKFLDVFELGLDDENKFPFSKGRLNMTPISFHRNIELYMASGLTVNTVTGSTFTADFRKEKFQCAIESMEGAAFHFVCLMEQIPFVQLRSISNYVEARDKSKWKMKEAIATLNNELIKIIEH